MAKNNVDEPKDSFKIKNLFLLTVLVITSVGFLFIVSVGNFYSFDLKDIFSKEAWMSPRNNMAIDTSTDTFSAEEMTDIRISLSEQGLFYYQQLSDEEKAVFDYIFLAVKNRKQAISFDTPIDSDLLTRIVYIIKFDCPEYYYLGDSFDYDLFNNGVTVFYPKYIMSERQYLKMQEKVDELVDDLIKNAEGLTEYDAEILIHNYIAEHTEYTTETTNCNNMYGCLIEGKANCEGYSSAFIYLLRKLGVESSQVIGLVDYNNEEVGHSWNLVKIDGIYSYVDVSWDDLENSQEYYDISYHYAFFNITYSEVIAERNVDKNIQYLGELPQVNDLATNYFYKNNIYAISIDDAKTIINSRLPAVVSSKDNYFMIKCNGKELYEELLSQITSLMQETINEKSLPVTKCSYIKIENGYTLIVHNLTYTQ